MFLLKRILSFSFFLLAIFAFWQCAKRGTPTGGPKDITPPVLLRTEPENLSINFDEQTIRLYFDEFIKLQDVQNQLIVSPPLKYIPEIKPLAGASKYIEITIKDTLRENTTYTINFGQSIVDNNEGNPNSFLSYVFSTGDYIDSLTLSGAVKDAYNRTAEQFVSVMLYEIDSAYNDSTIYNNVPNYITNTLDSLPFFQLKNLKAGKYSLVGMTDKAKNNLFDQRTDKIGFLTDTITIPTDSVYLLNLFMEEPDYSASVPSYVAKNRILFGYNGDEEIPQISALTQLPDSVKTKILKEEEKDTLNYWLSPTDLDSIIFTVTNEKLGLIDTFTVKTRKLGLDSLKLNPSHSRSFGFEDKFFIKANTPLIKLDTTLIQILDKDSVQTPYNASIDTIKNKIDIDFEVVDNHGYTLSLLPGAIEDFFQEQNDTLFYRLSTGSYADYGDLTLNLSGEVNYPVIVQLTTDNGDVIQEKYAEQPQIFEFNYLEPKEYSFRIIFDENANGKWDTGSYLEKIQPEVVKYYPDFVNVRAFSTYNETFIITN
ncbi:Ig-like domain-containing protein [Croceitalea rosinachiae]|uniref:Ig-like domain-containing protein n=1 Tax=Croceitalea rosinachiae TaxID=3075596 RepID=A0ABU3AC99_9FLAO|nr:Ig-like domain-containing protein [Croceitalea sp. F388]MDT0606541.1 Ig-like domain-containing protein [Croceitalea sp. F388]